MCAAATRYDAIVIGAGPNGLVAAAKLAGAGRSVLVLERCERVGGSAGLEQIAPGFRGPACFVGAELLAPRVVDELRLGEHGLRLSGDAPTSLLLPGAAALTLNTAGILESAPDDAEAYADLREFLDGIRPRLVALWSTPLPDIHAGGIRNTLDLLNIGWQLRRLGRRQMEEVMRFVPMPVVDVVSERFRSESLRALIAARGLAGMACGPFGAGTALNLAYHAALGKSPRELGGVCYAAGGGVVAALESAARAAGVEVRTGAEVVRVRMRRREADGVVLESGDEISAGVVVSSADPKSTFLDLVDPATLEPDFVRSVQSLRCRASVAILNLALDGLPRFSGLADGNGGSPLSGRLQIGHTVEYLERAADDCKHGRISADPVVELTVPSLGDPSLAPEGKHVLHAWVPYVPRELGPEHSWERMRDELADRLVTKIEEYSPGISERVVGRRLTTPADLEDRFGLPGGCPYHVDMALDQLLYLRPVPGWARYDTPIDRLYVCGSGTHPGGGVTGLPGHNAAQRVLRSDKQGAS